MQLIEEIELLKEKLEVMRPLAQATLQSIKGKVYLDWTYNSNAIEGNTLTLMETKVVLEGIAVGGKTIKEHLEVINHKDAILFLENIVQNQETLSEWNIKNIHQLLLEGIDDDNAGNYRTVPVVISGATHIPTEPFLIKEQMEDMIALYNNAWQKLSTVERAAYLHGEFVKIHPFIDGNGRTARLLLNFELMRNGYPPVIIEKGRRLEYYKALNIGHTTGNYIDFIELVASEVKRSLEYYLSF